MRLNEVIRILLIHDTMALCVCSQRKCHVRTHSKKAVVCKPGKRVSPNTEDALILGF